MTTLHVAVSECGHPRCYLGRPRLKFDMLAAQHWWAGLCCACNVPSGCSTAAQASGGLGLPLCCQECLRGSFHSLLVLHHE